MAKKAPQTAGSRYLRQDLGEDFPDQVEDDGDDPAAPSSTAPIVCLYEGPAVRFSIAGRNYRMKAGDVEHIQVGYVAQRQNNPAGDPIPSAIELMTGRKVLPVADPRVTKDKDGVPHVVLAARERAAQAERQAAAQTAKQTAGQTAGQGQQGAKA